MKVSHNQSITCFRCYLCHASRFSTHTISIVYLLHINYNKIPDSTNFLGCIVTKILKCCIRFLITTKTNSFILCITQTIYSHLSCLCKLAGGRQVNLCTFSSRIFTSWTPFLMSDQQCTSTESYLAGAAMYTYGTGKNNNNDEPKLRLA